MREENIYDYDEYNTGYDNGWADYKFIRTNRGVDAARDWTQSPVLKAIRASHSTEYTEGYHDGICYAVLDEAID